MFSVLFSNVAKQVFNETTPGNRPSVLSMGENAEWTGISVEQQTSG